MKVVATKEGFFNGSRVEVGKELDVSKEQFSKNWMEKVTRSTGAKKPDPEPEPEDTLGGGEE